jgi:hypothetical protein
VSGFQAVLLPDEAKRAMCLELLAEFGASVKRINDTTGELTHGCLVAPELHRNQDAEPTASLNYRKLTYKCLGCGGSGGFLWFIATCRGTSGTEARGWLEQQAGLGTSVMELDQMLRFLEQIYAKRRTEPLPVYSPRTLDAWAYDHPYLPEARGISQENLERFRVGWDPRTDRITLPHFWQGNLVGWQTRRMPVEYASQWPQWTPKAGTESPKYHSSPEFPKDSTIFNYSPVPSAVVVESMLSVIRHAHALDMVATFGASVTEDQARRLTKFDRVTLWMDNDRAGWTCVQGEAARKRTHSSPAREKKDGLAETLSRSVAVWVIPSPWSQDAGDLPTHEVLRLTAQAVPWTVWKPPGALYCYECKQGAHPGPCGP